MSAFFHPTPKKKEKRKERQACVALSYPAFRFLIQSNTRLEGKASLVPCSSWKSERSRMIVDHKLIMMTI